jgi:hypothetical protein
MLLFFFFDARPEYPRNKIGKIISMFLFLILRILCFIYIQYSCRYRIGSADTTRVPILWTRYVCAAKAKQVEEEAAKEATRKEQEEAAAQKKKEEEEAAAKKAQHLLQADRRAKRLCEGFRFRI